MGQAIVVQGLHKRFGSTRALDGVELTVASGEVHGFLGPNGAGKSTTIRILLGLLRGDAGRVVVLGGDPWRDAVSLHRRLAYVPGDVRLWPQLSGGEAIDLFGELRGGLDRRRRDALLERFQLDPTKRCGSYSKGNRQKVAIVAALASDVELFIFDEPTSGLDPLMETVFQDAVRERVAAGGTVLLSSHVLAEAEALCDRLSIIRLGRIVESGSLAELRHLTRTTIRVVTRQPVTGLAALPGVHDPQVRGGELVFELAGESWDPVLRHLMSFEIQSLVATPPTLAELFLRHYSAELAELSTPAASHAGGGA